MKTFLCLWPSWWYENSNIYFYTMEQRTQFREMPQNHLLGTSLPTHSPHLTHLQVFCLTLPVTLHIYFPTSWWSLLGGPLSTGLSSGLVHPSPTPAIIKHNVKVLLHLLHCSHSQKSSGAASHHGHSPLSFSVHASSPRTSSSACPQTPCLSKTGQVSPP